MAWRRERMRNITDERVWEALNSIPRGRFIDKGYQHNEFLDAPLPIGYGQTISQPSLVAYMTQLLMLEGSEKVLEIGTGSGYQTAFLARLAKEVYTIELIKPLQLRAKEVLKSLGYSNIHYKLGSGYDGWKEHAPYDAVMVTCAFLMLLSANWQRAGEWYYLWGRMTVYRCCTVSPKKKEH